jgi:hypothetical protein
MIIYKLIGRSLFVTVELLYGTLGKREKKRMIEHQ